MVRLKAFNPDLAVGKTKDLFNAVNATFGIVPNMMRTMGNSAAFLEGFLNLSGALSKGTLGVKNSALIALAVAEINGCNYCLSAHTYLGTNLAKLDAETMEAARQGKSSHLKTQAILQFAQTLVRKRGHVADTDVNAIKNAGLTEGEIGEIIGHVALNTLTNYLNSTANTDIDFPIVKSFQPATV